MNSQLQSNSSGVINRFTQQAVPQHKGTGRLPKKVEPAPQPDSANLAESDHKPGSKDFSKIPLVESNFAELHIPHIIFDDLLPTLSPAESLVYLRLYRLSYGFNRKTCSVSIWKLGKAVNLSERTTHRAVYLLEQRGLIQRTGHVFGSKGGGLVFQVNLPPVEVSQATNHPPILASVPGDLFADCHGSEITSSASDLRLEEVKAAYTRETGNCWRQADAAAYEKIKHIQAEKIVQAIVAAKTRAASRPNSFSYFIKEILDQANPSAQSRTSRKHALKRIVDRIRYLHLGAHDYTPIDFIEDVKTASACEGVLFDNDLFNEISR